MIKLSIKKDDIEFNTGFLKPKDSLYPKFWKNDNLNPIVARKLMQIADDVIKSLKLGADVEDVIITGSIASYNWHELSDIDLHFMLDFEKIDENFDLVKRMYLILDYHLLQLVNVLLHFLTLFLFLYLFRVN